MNPQVIVATHNEESVRLAAEQMAELGVPKRGVDPEPCTLNPAPYTLHPAP